MALRAVLTRRGGSPTLTDLPFSSLTATRLGNEAGSATVTIGVGVDDATAQRLADAVPWRDEINVWDENDDTGPLWSGPLRPPTWTREQVTLPASDLFSWFDHRLLPRSRQYRDADLGLIFTNHALDGLAGDPSPNIAVHPAVVGVAGDRDVLASQRLIAGDAMRELMRSGVDFTMAGRDLILTGIEPGRLPPLVDGYVDDPQAGPAGDTVTEVTVLGTAGSGVQAVGLARAPDAAGGLLQVARNEPAIRDNTSARHAAQVELAAALIDSTPLTALLMPGWTGWGELVPGRVTQVGLTVGVRTVLGDHRLVSVTFNAAPDGFRVSGTFMPVMEV